MFERKMIVITQVKVCSRNTMDRLAFSDFGYPKFGNVWHLISIHGDSERLMSPEVVAIFKSLGMKEWLSQEFWDITDDPVLIEQLRKSYPKYILFSRKQAKEIVDFINERQKEPEDSVLVCHCDAGISRSGAVATFACEACGLDYMKFKQMNPFIHPNHMVLRMLRKAAGMNRQTDFLVAFEEDQRKKRESESKLYATIFE